MGEGITTARARLMNFWIRARCTIEVTCYMTEGQRCKSLVSVDFHLCTRKREREECGRDDTWRSPLRVTSSGFTSRRKEREARNQRALGTVDKYVCVRRVTIKNLKRATRMLQDGARRSNVSNGLDNALFLKARVSVSRKVYVFCCWYYPPSSVKTEKRFVSHQRWRSSSLSSASTLPREHAPVLSREV